MLKIKASSEEVRSIHIDKRLIHTRFRSFYPLVSAILRRNNVITTQLGKYVVLPFLLCLSESSAFSETFNVWKTHHTIHAFVQKAAALVITAVVIMNGPNIQTKSYKDSIAHKSPSYLAL